MRLVVQRVARASVTVEGEITGKIGKGYMVLAGAETGDTEADARLCADKLAGLRVFEDSEGKMNLYGRGTGQRRAGDHPHRQPEGVLRC